jgi:hypothetical protein
VKKESSRWRYVRLLELVLHGHSLAAEAGSQLEHKVWLAASDDLKCKFKLYNIISSMY